MSAEANVEIARRFTETLARGDYDAAAAMVAPDFTVDDTDIPESTGADSFHEWIGRWDAAFESWRIEDLEVRSIRKDRTLSLFRIYARGTGSGIELARDDASIAEFRDARSCGSPTTTTRPRRSKPPASWGNALQRQHDPPTPLLLAQSDSRRGLALRSS